MYKLGNTVIGRKSQNKYGKLPHNIEDIMTQMPKACFEISSWQDFRFNNNNEGALDLRVLSSCRTTDTNYCHVVHGE